MTSTSSRTLGIWVAGVVVANLALAAWGMMPSLAGPVEGERVTETGYEYHVTSSAGSSTRWWLTPFGLAGIAGALAVAWWRTQQRTPIVLSLSTPSLELTRTGERRAA